MSFWTASAVVVLTVAAVAALTRREEWRQNQSEPGAHPSFLAAAAWPLTATALVSAVVRILLLY